MAEGARVEQARILATGAAGFIGSNWVRMAMARWPAAHFVVLDALTYAASKAGGDRLAFAYSATYNAPIIITRCSNNYGPYQYPEKLIPLFVTNALEDKPLPVYGSGKNRRDWIHVEDHCEALCALLEA